MTFSIQCCLDPTSSERIRSLWSAIGPRCVLNNTDPHISLVNFEGPCPSELVSELSTLAAAVASLEIEVCFTGISKSLRSIMLLPVVTQQLFALHERINDLAKNVGIEPLPHYQVNRWAPHITIADETDFDDFEAALKIVLNSDFIRSVTLESVRLIEFKPVSEICSFKLAG